MNQTLGQMDAVKQRKREMSQATNRLKRLEQLEQYREEKVAKEMMMLEMQRKLQEEQIMK